MIEYNEHTLINDILSDMSDGILVIGFDGEIKLHNHAAEKMLGLPASAFNGKSIAFMMNCTDNNDQLFESILVAVHTKQRSIKTVPYFYNHNTLYLRVTTDLLHSSGKITGVIAQITDITEATMLFIENKRLAGQVLDLMNSFVEVMVTAIEKKSTYNATHTKSMVRYAAKYLEWLAEQDRLTDYTAENTAPFLMSIWLHDIGKLLVPKEIMDKPTRLGDWEKDVMHRIETAKLLLKIGMLSHPEQQAALEEQTKQLAEAEALICTANRAPYLDTSVIEQLHAAASIPCPAADGSVHPLLTDQELEFITIQRGTLTPKERKMIEEHVSYTKKLLSKVEFRGDYRTVPKWAAGHHEMLDGSGYPDHLTAADIPWETRLLTIIDIYDALTAEDRPYKPPIQPERAFSILRDMAAHGKLDREIIESFYESHAWDKSDNG